MSKFHILSNNALKIIACISMVFDHLGAICFPDALWFRLIGRIAYPIFAFCIAEGCFYTHNKIKHLVIMALFGIVIYAVEYLLLDILSFNIMITFALSIILIYLFDDANVVIKEKKIGLSIVLISILCVFIVGLNIFVHYTDYFEASYGFYGIMLPFILYVIKKYLNDKRYCVLIQCLAIIVLTSIRIIRMDRLIYLYSFIACLFLLMYNGKRGKWNIKYLFYFFYPLHLVIIYLISLLIH